MCTGGVTMSNRSYEQGDVQNESYESDIHYIFQMSRWTLKPIGMWPLVYSRTTAFEKVSSVVVMIMCFATLCFVLVPPGYYMLFDEKDISLTLKLFGPVGFCFTSTIKYFYVGLRGRAFGRCISHVEKDWKILRDQEHRAIMIKNITMGRRLSILCAFFFYFGGLSYHTVLPLLSKKSEGNVTFRPLTYPGYDMFFDPHISPTYEIVFCVHCFYAFVAYNITTAAYSLAAIFVTHACGQIQIQIARLEKLVEGRSSSLAIIVRDHVQVLRFTKQVERILRDICLMEIVASTLTICLLEYYCMVEWNNSDNAAILTYCLLLISFTFNVLLFCYIGELLVEQGGKIGQASYDIEWYNLPPKNAAGLILLIAISKYPPKLTAGKMFNLSLNTFGAVLKSSVMYLNLLRAVTE